MNFKFLFKNNINDNRLMLLTTGAGGTAGTLKSSTIKFNGIDTGYVYDDALSARQNRKLLKLTLKAKGIGDKADATGLISEYLTSNGGAVGKDAAWLAKKSKLYGYTTDANGNRDYHRNPSNAGKIFTTIGGALLGGPLGAFGGYMLANLNSQIPGLKKGFFNPTSVVKPNDVSTDPVTEEPDAEDPVTEAPVKPTSYTFSGFSGPWGSHIETVYNDHQLSDHWGKMDTNQDGDITKAEFSAYLGLLGEEADGKLGRNTLAALELLGNYSWMNPGGNGGNSGGGKYTPGSDEMWVDDTRAFGFKGDVNGKQGYGGYVNRADWEKARTDWYNDWESNVKDEQKLKWNEMFGEGNYTVEYSPTSKQYIAKAINYGKVPGKVLEYNTLYGEGNWNMAADGKTVKYAQHKAPLRLENNTLYQGNKKVLSFRPKLYSVYNLYTINPDGKILLNGVVLPNLRLNNGQIEIVQPNGTTTPWLENLIFTYMAKGGALKFQQGGQLDDQDKMLLASTLGMIGYAASQGKLMLIEEAAAQVASLALSQPESLQELASNKELVNAGILIVGLETVQKLSQPGVMKLLLSNIVNKMPKAMKGTKLNYIKELKGICPEGYEMQYFAKGGHLCPVCKPKKVEEAKCGKKMKAKKHEGGGGVSTTVNDIKNLMKDNQQTPQKQTSKKQAPKKMVYNQKEHDRLIKEFQTNPKGKFSYKGWPKAKQDSLTWFNANDPREDGV